MPAAGGAYAISRTNACAVKKSMNGHCPKSGDRLPLNSIATPNKIGRLRTPSIVTPNKIGQAPFAL